jgi:hypothetical protein
LPQLGDFLNRFRPAGAPGAASRIGVPADRAAELSAELEPVLAMLAATEAECSRLVTQAEQQTGRIGAETHDTEAGIRADAVRLGQQARAAAAADVIAAAAAQAERTEHLAAEQAAARPGPNEEEVRALIATAIELVTSMGGHDR